MSWPVVPFEDLYACPSKNGVTRPSRVRGAGVRMINMGELFAHDRIGNIEMERVHLNDKELDSMLVEPGDLLFARQSLVLAGAGKCSIVVDVAEPTTFESHLIRVRLNRDLADTLFYHYYFKSPNAGMKSIVTQGVQAGIRGSDLKRLPVRLPPRSTQSKIAKSLSAYDDLIENSRRRIALLEEAARLLYREWFVHLRFPGHEHVKVVDGVPEGWVRNSLRELADCRLGKMLDQKKNKGELMPYLANVNVRWGAIDLNNLREMRFEDSELDAVGLQYGDIVMCEGGEPGRCALWKEQLPRMMIQKAIHRIRARVGVSYLFLYYSLRHKGQSGQLAPLFTGATIKHLPLEKLSNVQVDVPPAALMMRFAEQVDATERQITLLESAARRASQARDLLLPRLISGDIAV